MKKYKQLNEYDRVKIYENRKKMSVADLAQKVDKHKSTIYREFKRNSDQIGYLFPRDAQQKTNIRKARHGSKIDRITTLKDYMIEQIKLNKSPVIIAGCWNKDHPNQTITAETIYRFAYHQKNKHLKLWINFPKAKKKRGMARKRKTQSAIPHRISIHNRPQEIEKREEFGHFEADLIFNKGSMSQNVLVVVERKSRKVFLFRQGSKHAIPITKSLKSLVDQGFVISITFDNGSEFSQHATLGVSTYFCDKASPWQKGSVENMNGLLRTYLPFELKADLITQQYLDEVAHMMNTIERKLLNFSTPMEVFLKEIKEKHSQAYSFLLKAHDYQKFSTVALHN